MAAEYFPILRKQSLLLQPWVLKGRSDLLIDSRSLMFISVDKAVYAGQTQGSLRNPVR